MFKPTPQIVERLRDNVARIRSRIVAAAGLANRPADSIRLVAVTKYISADLASVLVDLGCHDLGESRPQELWSKAGLLAGREISWHLIGHLQRNKAARSASIASWFHAGDSQRILEALNATCAQHGVRPAVLLEVNVTGDRAKTGMPVAELESIASILDRFDHLRIAGLMAMSGLQSDSDSSRAEFHQVRELRDRLQKQCPAGVRLSELSMGMSDDFEEAILEGATMVRVGSALFSGLELAGPQHSM